MSYYEYTWEREINYYPLPEGGRSMIQSRPDTMSVNITYIGEDECYIRGTKELVTWIQFDTNAPKQPVAWFSKGPNGIMMRLQL